MNETIPFTDRPHPLRVDNLGWPFPCAAYSFVSILYYFLQLHINQPVSTSWCHPLLNHCLLASLNTICFPKSFPTQSVHFVQHFHVPLKNTVPSIKQLPKTVLLWYLIHSIPTPISRSHNTFCMYTKFAGRDFTSLFGALTHLKQVCHRTIPSQCCFLVTVKSFHKGYWMSWYSQSHKASNVETWNMP